MRSSMFLCIVVFLSVAGASTPNGRVQSARSSPPASNWEYALYTPNALRHGLEGPGVSPTGVVTVGSVLGETIYQVDVNSGAFTTYVGVPNGEADDEVFGPDGTLVWTSILSGVVRSKTPDGVIHEIASVPPVGPNGVAFDLHGNCYFTQYPSGTGLWKVDPTGKKNQTLILELPSPMNGFDFGPDNQVYGPFSMTGQIAKVNLATKQVTIIASGFLDPESVRWSADKTKLFVLDTGINAVYQLDPNTGARFIVAQGAALSYFDNFRPYGDNFLLSDTVTNSFQEYITSTKTLRYVTPVSVFGLPMGISIYNNTVYIADYAAQRTYDLKTGQDKVVARSGPQPASSGPSAVNISFGIYNVFATDRYLAFSDFFDGRVQIRDRRTNADVIDTIPISGFSPYGLAITADYKYLVVCDFGAGLHVFSGTNYSNDRLINVGDNTLTGLVLSPTKANTLYVATFTGSVYRVNYITGAIQRVASGFSDPEGLAVRNVGGQDYLYVANVGAQNIIELNAANGAKNTIATGLPIGLPGPDTLPPPNTFTGIDIAANGDIYITSDLNDALIRVPYQPTAQEFCASQNVPAGHQEYFCNKNGGFFQCVGGSNAQSASMMCAQGTACGCGYGVACSCGGQKSPCTLVGQPQTC